MSPPPGQIPDPDDAAPRQEREAARLYTALAALMRDQTRELEGVRRDLANVSAERDALRLADTEDRALFKAMVLFTVRVARILGLNEQYSPAQVVDALERIAGDAQRYAQQQHDAALHQPTLAARCRTLITTWEAPVIVLGAEGDRLELLRAEAQTRRACADDLRSMLQGGESVTAASELPR